MKRLNTIIALAGLAALVALGCGQSFAQDKSEAPATPGGPSGGAGPGGPGGMGGPGGGGFMGMGPGRGNFDPQSFMQQIQARMLEGFREQLGVTNDTEWNVISDRLSKVMQARTDVTLNNFGGLAGFGGRGGNQEARRMISSFGPPNPERDALQGALDTKASGNEIKSKLSALRENRKQKQSKLDKAQEELRQVLTLRQEALLVLGGMLD
jgi:Spy/CpxP family protein refolding chaperone